MNNIFDKRRFGLLCKNEVVSNYKMWGIYAATVIGVYVGLSVLMAVIFRVFIGSTGVNSFHPNTMFPAFLFIGGFILTSLTFSDLNNKFTNSLWLSVPGSTLEKYLVSALISSIGYVIFLSLAFVVASIISSILCFLITGVGMEIFNQFTISPFFNNAPIDFDSSTWGLSMSVYILVYILTQPMFLVGSIIFKKIALIKTVLAVYLIQAATSIVLFIIFVFVFKTGIYRDWDISIFRGLQLYLEAQTEIDTFLPFMVKLIAITELPAFIFFHVVGYLKLAEKEVKGGI